MKPIALPLLFAIVISASLRAEENLPTLFYKDIPALQGLVPQKTPYYQIEDTVQVKDHSYIFQVRADHAEYEVKSITLLITVCHEIRAIEEFRKTEHGSQAWQGAKDSAQGIGKGAKRVVLHPGQSAKALGRGIGKLGRKVGRLFGRKKKEDEPEEMPERDKGAGGTFAGGHARNLAYQLELDVYSDNPYVQGLLTEVAKDRWKGSLGLSGATFLFLPLAGLGAVAKGSLTATARDEVTEQLIRDNDPPELRRSLRLKYRDEYQLEKDSIEDERFERFLKSPYYSPREQAYIYLYLSHLKGATGREVVVQHLIDLKEVEAAMAAVKQLELISTSHRYAWPATKLVPFDHQIGFVMRNNELIVLSPTDCGLGDALKSGVKKIARKKSYKAVRVFVLDRYPEKLKSTLKRYKTIPHDLLLQSSPFVAAREAVAKADSVRQGKDGAD